MISGTSNILLKSGPGDLLTITKMLQKIQEKYGIILEKYYLCQYGTHKILKTFGKLHVLGTIFSDFVSDFRFDFRSDFLVIFEYMF